MIRKTFLVAATLAAFAMPASAPAELPQGARAPAFVTQGAQNGKTFAFNLRLALKRGPVVLYFYPKSFTQGCTLEAKAFADAMDDFHAAGATVIGLSIDTIETQIKFSGETCRDRFPVGVATPRIVGAYDVMLKDADGKPRGMTSRTSYVIGRDGKVAMVYSNMDWREHVSRSLEAVRKLKGQPKR